MTMRARAGMTLMELTVAIIVTAFMATIGVGTFTSIINHRRVILEATIDTERAAALREVLRTWIGSGVVAKPAGGTPVGRAGAATAATGSTQMTTITAAVSTGDEITFTTSALTPAGTPNVSVRLFIDGDPNTLEVGLTIEYRTAPQAPLQRKQIDPMFLDANGFPQPMQAMTVEFLDQATSLWYPYSQAATVRTPIAVQVSFPPVDGTMPPPPLLQMPLIFAMTQSATTTGRGG